MIWKDKIKASLAAAMGMQVTNAPRQTFRVLAPGATNLFVTEHENDQRQTVLRVAHVAGQSSLVLSLDGRDSSVVYYQNAVSEPSVDSSPPVEQAGQRPPRPRERDKLIYRPGSELLAVQLYGQLKRSVVSGTRAGAWAWRQRAVSLALWLVAAAGLILLLGQAGSGGAIAAKSQPGSVAPTPTVAPVATAQAETAAPLTGERIPAEARASEQERSAVAALQGVIKVGAAGKPFYVFTDPNCPYCRDFEKTLENVPPGFQAIIIPLGYKAGSAATVAGVLCSANPAAEWRQTMLHQPSPTLKSCESGERMMRENMALFEAMRLNRTPTILTPASFLVSGAASPQELAMILGVNRQ